METVIEKKGNRIITEKDTSVYGVRMSDGKVKKVHKTKDGYVDNEGNAFKSTFVAPKGIDLLILKDIKEEVAKN